MNKNYLIIGLIILALVVIGVIASRPGEEIVVDNGTNGPDLTADRPSIEVDAQTLSNNQIAIDRIVSESEGWVVIHRVDADGNTDTSSYVGYSRIATGNNSGVIVTLDEEVSSGEMLAAVLYLDEGSFGELEIGEGDEAVDTPVTIDGEVVSTQFTVVIEDEAAETEEVEESEEDTSAETEDETTE